MNINLLILCGIIIITTSCNRPTDASPDSNQDALNNNSISTQLIGSWTLDLETMQDNAPPEIQQNIEMLSMMGGDLFKIDFLEGGIVNETGLGGMNSAGIWVENGKGVSVTFEPNEMQKEMLERAKESSPEMVIEIQNQLQRDIQLVGPHLIFEFSMGPRKLTFYLTKF
ncbi:MAG: hypothetical protein H8E85_03650 [Candidatus Marinimicrobia bacterium]|nr:hypothetical protein [Candidatus Neomarinimicrobiota bacterium]